MSWSAPGHEGAHPISLFGMYICCYIVTTADVPIRNHHLVWKAQAGTVSLHVPLFSMPVAGCLLKKKDVTGYRRADACGFIKKGQTTV